MSDIIESMEEAEALKLGETIDERIANMLPAEKDLWLRVMFLLNASQRYTDFIDENFEIHTAVHEETKSIDVAVIEKPAVKEVEFKTGGDLQLDVQKSLKAQMLLKKNGCENTADVLKGIYEILTNTPIDELVTSASDADINKELEAVKAANKFKA